jgi:hypothetical protein
MRILECNLTIGLFDLILREREQCLHDLVDLLQIQNGCGMADLRTNWHSRGVRKSIGLLPAVRGPVASEEPDTASTPAHALIGRREILAHIPEEDL